MAGIFTGSRRPSHAFVLCAFRVQGAVRDRDASLPPLC